MLDDEATGGAAGGIHRELQIIGNDEERREFFRPGQ
jgi:hypothetical protein